MLIKDYYIDFHPNFLKQLKKLSHKDQEGIKKALNIMLDTQELKNIKKLSNYKNAQYRIRIGNFRILFNQNLNKKRINFLTVKNRKQLY